MNQKPAESEEKARQRDDSDNLGFRAAKRRISSELSSLRSSVLEKRLEKLYNNAESKIPKPQSDEDKRLLEIYKSVMQMLC